MFTDTEISFPRMRITKRRLTWTELFSRNTGLATYERHKHAMLQGYYVKYNNIVVCFLSVYPLALLCNRTKGK